MSRLPENARSEAPTRAEISRALNDMDMEGIEDVEGDLEDLFDESLLEDEDESLEEPEPDEFARVPVIFPRARYAGACNVRTVKDGAYPH